MNPSLSALSPELCAEQFDSYAYANANRGRDAEYHSGACKAYTHAAAFLREFAIMRWSSGRPTKPGWYWGRNVSSGGVPFIAEIVRDREGELQILGDAFAGGIYPLRYHPAEWAGPIPEPISSP